MSAPPFGARPFDWVLGGLVAAALALGLARASREHPTRPADLRAARATGAVRIEGPKGEVVFHPNSGRLTLRAKDGGIARDVELALVVDGVAEPLTLDPSAPRMAQKNGFGASLPVTVGETTYDVLFTLGLDTHGGAAASDTFVASLTVKADETTTPHAFALRFTVPTGGAGAFVSGTGELADLGAVTGALVELDAGPRALGVVGGHGPLDVAAVGDATEGPHAPLRITATTTARTPTPTQPAVADLKLVLGESPARIWRTLYEAAGVPTARIHGVVTGTAAERAEVFGLDGEGVPRVRAPVGPDGRFELDVPTSVTSWYAALDPSRTSAPITFVPGTPWDLRLDVAPAGELRVTVTDADTGAPLVARLVVHGIDGTLDPSFGPDYRASGAGPLLDARTGEIATPLPAGRYRIAATKGIEWSIDAQTVDIVSGHTVDVALAPRHVVATPGIVGCDLHVHARPSFDTPVSPEDRVLSLVSAGIDFAVPSEHNIVGDYGPSLDAMELASQLAFVPGVEVTTFRPQFGHFGVFPYPLGTKPPPYRATHVGAVFKAAKKGDPNRILQVNHPRLPKGIGYFEIVRYDPKKPPPANMRTDFDTLEVYNGYDLEFPGRVDAVMRDWFSLLSLGHRYVATGSSDSHRIQYQWAGYPRTMVTVGDAAAGDHGAPVDPQAVVRELKKGHATVTSGPIVDLTIDGVGPGDELAVDRGKDAVTAHVRVRAAPWVDVTEVQLVVGGAVAVTRAVAPRPTRIGPETGSAADVAAASVRFEEDLRLPVGAESTWVVAIARGTRKMDDVLPFMPIPPLGFTNPVYLARP